MTASVVLPAAELAKLSAAMRTLAAATGRSGEEITRAFAGRLLKRWAGATKVTTAAQIERRARARAKSAPRSGARFAGASVGELEHEHERRNH